MLSPVDPELVSMLKLSPVDPINVVTSRSRASVNVEVITSN